MDNPNRLNTAAQYRAQCIEIVGGSVTTSLRYVPTTLHTLKHFYTQLSYCQDSTQYY